MIVLPESPSAYRCNLCGERYWNRNETIATIRRKEYKNDTVTTTVWEFHVCDKCLKKLVMGEGDRESVEVWDQWSPNDVTCSEES